MFLTSGISRGSTFQRSTGYNPGKLQAWWLHLLLGQDCQNFEHLSLSCFCFIPIRKHLHPMILKADFENTSYMPIVTPKLLQRPSPAHLRQPRQMRDRGLSRCKGSRWVFCAVPIDAQPGRGEMKKRQPNLKVQNKSPTTSGFPVSD